MKNSILYLSLIFLASCSGGMLNKEFTYDFYEKLDYEKLLKSPDVSDADLFLINYSVIRQRDYFNYTIEGKTYGEILALAKAFDQTGFPVEVAMNDNGKQDKIEQKISDIKVGMVRSSKNSKRIQKTLNFTCDFKNTTGKDIVMLNSSFVVKGPFDDYLTTVNYEINCILKANTTVIVKFIIPGKTIQQNLLFEGSPFIQRLGIDNIFNSTTIIPSGMSLKDQGRYFKECFFNANVLDPHVTIDFNDDLKDKKWKVGGSDGQFKLDFGDMHVPDTSDEVIQMR